MEMRFDRFQLKLLVILLYLFPMSIELELLFANRRDIRMLEINTTNPSPRSGSTISTVINNLSDVTSLDWVGSKICWIDIDDGAIHCEENGQRETIVNDNIPSPEDMAIDWLTSKIYFTDSESNRIEVASIVYPYYRAVIIQDDLDQPRAIVVSPKYGLMFFSDWGENPKIESSTMAGTNRRAIVTTDLFWPNGLTLDNDRKLLYWVDAKSHTISFVNFEGQGRGKLNRETTEHPFAIVLAGNGFYWSDWNTNSLHYLKNVISPQRPVTLAPRHPLTPMDIVDFSPRPKINDPCKLAGCSHLCLLVSGPNAECTCPTGIVKVNQTHCNNRMNKFLLVARGTEMRIISLDTPREYIDVVLPFKGLKHILAVDFDEVDGWVYWTDDEKRVIERAKIDGSEQASVISTQITHPDGLAIDPIAHNLYFTDAGTDRIEVCKLDGSFRRVIISKHLQEPRAIAVDPVAGYLFWSDWGKKPKIERSRLDGSERNSIITDSISWPNGIALDIEKQLIYWCDGKLDKIEVVPYNGSPRTVLISSNLPHTFGFTILQDDLYFTDWQRRVIEKVDKNTGRNRIVIKDPFSDPMGLKAVERDRWKNITNGCSQPSICSELCFWMGDHVKCGCRSSHELNADNRTCSKPDSFLIYAGVGDLHRVSFNRSEEDEVIPIGKLKSPVAVETWKEYIFWSDSRVKTLSKARVDGTGGVDKIIETGLFHTEDLAIDRQTGLIYWTDFNGKVEVCTLDGKYRKTVVWNIEGPKSIVVDQDRRQLYFSLWSTSTSSGIFKTEMDGTRRIQFASGFRANGLTVDNSYLYFANIDSESIISKSVLTGEERIVFRGLSPYRIAIHADWIYFSSISNKSIYYMKKQDNNYSNPNIEPQVLLHNAGNVLDMTVYTEQPAVIQDKCGCKVGFCMALINKAYCSCSNHFSLVNDTCLGPQQFLIISTPTSILRILDENSPDDVIVNVKGVRGLDWGNNVVYSDGGRLKGLEWIDEAIFKASQPKLHEGWEIAVDRDMNWVFFSTFENGINVSTSAVFGGTVVPKSDYPPRDLRVHPPTSSLFYIQNYAIYRVRYDGQKLKKIIDDGVTSIYIDSNILYYSQGQVIWKTDLDGNQKVVIGSVNDDVRALAVWKDSIFYFTPSGLFKLSQKIPHKDSLPFFQGVITFLRFVNLNETSVNPCLNSKCSFCVQGMCSCPPPLILAPDYQHCVQKLSCGAGEWECSSGAIGCIGSLKRCDGVINCFDEGSDEEHCLPETKVCENCEEEDKSPSSGPWFAGFGFISVIVIVCILVFICRRRQKARQPKIATTTTIEPLFHHPPSSLSHPSSSPYCELLAPHPSPATDCCREYCSINPPPTPCSTDVCSDVVYSPPPPSPMGSSIRKGSTGYKRSAGYYIPPPPSPT